ncbi:uncharacterized protein LOC141885719 isoform X3 [Acropora palmata]|uniref:uncharacterized protein LOC141885719 isoform X3 n=1 Tax=Acropora palmata TaxID=6131 RepID=UPI003DA1B1D0
MKTWARSSCINVVILVINLNIVFGKDLLLPKCVKIVSISIPLDDPTKAEQNYGLHADKKKAVLTSKPGIFKIHEGLSVENGTVSLESIYHPGYFLRHKNYQFHLEKKENKSIFNKDATFFILKVTDKPALYAFELSSHPSWFLGHRKSKPYRVVLRKVDESSKEVLDSTFHLTRRPCYSKTNKDEPEEDGTIVNPQDKEKLSEDTITIHTSQDDTKTKKELPNPRAEVGSNDTNTNIIREVEEAYKISQNASNATVLENIEKDIQNKVNAMAAVAEGSTNDRSDTEEIDKEHDEKAGDAEIHSETNELVDVENDTSSEPADNSSKGGQEDRTEKGPQDMEKSKMSSSGNEETEIDKDIVITGEPKLNGRVHIDTNLYFEHRQKNARNESSKNTTVTRPAYREEKPDKSQLIGTVGHVVSSESTHAQTHKAYHDYEVAHKVLSKNIEKLKNVLEAIEDTHKTKNTEYSNRKFNRDEGLVQQKPLFNDRKATNSLQLANHSDQHSIKNGSLLSHTRSLGLKEQPLSSKDSIGLHVVEGNGNQTVDIRSQASSDVVDRIANDLVRHGVTSEPNGSSVNQWVNGLPYHNNTLQETLKELKPDDTNILYLRTCEDKFPKACEEWAAKRYCLTFGELMKRYCRKACKLCNNVLTTAFTQCDKSCGGGIRLRMIKVNNRQVLQRRSCNMQSCPIHGGYSSYSNWSECSVTCGKGVRYRHRSCTNPRPQFGGRDCSRFGPPVDTMPCVKSCKGFTAEHHLSADRRPLKGKSHSTSHLDPDDYPEYVAEENNPKIMESGNGHFFQWPPKHRRKKPVVLDHVHKNVYKHKDATGKNHYLQVDEEKSPYDAYQTHVVRYQGQQVANLQCSPSKLLQYHKHVPNIPVNELYRRNNPFKMYQASGGDIVLNKDDNPTDTTKNIVQSYDSPYKIILQRGKNDKMKVSEQCIESDASVDPESYWKNGAQSYEGTTSLGSEQASLSDPSSTTATGGMSSNHFTEDVGTTSFGNVQASVPEATRVTTDSATSNINRLNDDGLYEYKYQDIGQGLDDKTYESDVSAQLTRAMNKETAGITQRFLRNQDPKPTLKEELLAEKEEELREKKYEDYISRRSKG